jgi:hypothetical protein
VAKAIPLLVLGSPNPSGRACIFVFPPKKPVGTITPHMLWTTAQEQEGKIVVLLVEPARLVDRGARVPNRIAS